MTTPIEQHKRQGSSSFGRSSIFTGSLSKLNRSWTSIKTFDHLSSGWKASNLRIAAFRLLQWESHSKILNPNYPELWLFESQSRLEVCKFSIFPLSHAAWPMPRSSFQLERTRARTEVWVSSKLNPIELSELAKLLKLIYTLVEQCYTASVTLFPISSFNWC